MRSTAVTRVTTFLPSAHSTDACCSRLVGHRLGARLVDALDRTKRDSADGTLAAAGSLHLSEARLAAALVATGRAEKISRLREADRTSSSTSRPPSQRLLRVVACALVLPLPLLLLLLLLLLRLLDPPDCGSSGGRGRATLGRHVSRLRWAGAF
jgi:hypothetical protein